MQMKMISKTSSRIVFYIVILSGLDNDIFFRLSPNMLQCPGCLRLVACGLYVVYVEECKFLQIPLKETISGSFIIDHSC